MPPRPKKCEDCQYCVIEDGYGAHCRRYPPVHIGPERTLDGYVRVHLAGWCGEYKRKRGRS